MCACVCVYKWSCSAWCHCSLIAVCVCLAEWHQSDVSEERQVCTALSFNAATERAGTEWANATQMAMLFHINQPCLALLPCTCLVEAESSSVCLSVWLRAKPLVGASGGAVGCWIVFVSVLRENVLKVTENMVNSMASCMLSTSASFVSLTFSLSDVWCLVSKNIWKCVDLKWLVAWEILSHIHVLKFLTICSTSFLCFSTNVVLEITV